MSRNNADKWLEFKGVSSAAFSAYLADANIINTGEWSGTTLTAAGRDGDYWQPGAYMPYQLKRTLRFPLAELDNVLGWLHGTGALRLYYAENRSIDARITKAVSIRQLTPGSNGMCDATVTFDCQPFKRQYPESADITITASGQPITGVGNAPALPRVKIAGAGSFTVMIGANAMNFVDITGGIIVDSELMDAFTVDGAALYNANVSGDFFELDPTSPITVGWTLESGATISSITITPRWRWR